MGVILIKAFLVCRDFVDNAFIRNSFKENCLAFEYNFILFYFFKKGALIVFLVKCYIQRNDFWKNVISSDCLKITLIDFLNF